VSQIEIKRSTPVSLRLIVYVLAFLFSFPGIYLVWRNFTEDSDPIALIKTERVLAPLWRTVSLAFTVSITTAVVGTGLAWLTSRTDLYGDRLWRVLLPIPLVFPTFIGAAAFIRTMNPGGLMNRMLDGIGVETVIEMRGFFGAWLVLTLFCYPYVYLPVAARLRQLPKSLEENARVLGQSSFQTFRRIVLPQVGSILAAGSLLVFLYTISDFGAVQLMRYDTLTRSIYTNRLINQPTALALSLLLLLLAAVIVLSERFFSRVTFTSEESLTGEPLRYELGKWRVPALLSVLVVVLLSIGAPMLALGDWAADGISRTTRGGSPLTIDRGQVVESTWNTLSISVISGIVAVLAVLPIAFLVSRYRSRSGTFAHAVVIATFAVPGLLIALSMRFWILRTDWAFDLLDNTKTLLVFSYIVRFGSLAMGVVLVAVAAVPKRLHDVGQTLGVRRTSRFLRIDFPLMAPGLGAAAGLVILSTMKELPITLLISPLGFSTLATRIFSSFEDAFVAEAGIMAVILVLLSFVLTWLLVIRRADHL
tara:strand:- start:413 stop:2017 length:1605 start_codon:yes stop_codon:yes gene_type:complete